MHPTQLYSTAFNWVIAAFCYWWYRKKQTLDGETFWIFGVLYALARFMVELVRADERGEYFGVSTSQGIGVLWMLFSLYMLHRLYMQSQQKPPDGELASAPDPS